MDRGEWQATVHEVARVGHDLVTKPLTTKFDDYSTILFSVFIILCFKCLQFGLKKSCEQQTSLLCHLRNDDQLSEWLRPQWVAPGFLLIFSLQYFFPVSSWILVCKPWGRGRKCIFIEVRSQTRCTEILDSISHFLQKQMAPKVWWVSPVCFFFFFLPN